MQHPLQTHLQRFIPITEAEFSVLLTYLIHLEIGKKHMLLEEAKVCRANYFIIKGCLRLFFVNEKGGEQTIDFALENWWISDYASLTSQKPSEFYIQSIEKSSLLALPHDREEEVLFKIPQMERYFRLIQQRAHAASQQRIKNLYRLSKEESYRLFTERFPAFVERVPQYLLASFLGITPEYLSEIKKKLKS